MEFNKGSEDSAVPGRAFLLILFREYAAWFTFRSIGAAEGETPWCLGDDAAGPTAELNVGGGIARV